LLTFTWSPIRKTLGVPKELFYKQRRTAAKRAPGTLQAAPNLGRSEAGKKTAHSNDPGIKRGESGTLALGNFLKARWD